VGYLQDATGTNNTPAGVVPAYLNSPYYAAPASVAPGTLYVATMLPGIGVTNMPVGSATLRLSADNSKAVLNFSVEGISSTIISEHIDNDPYLGSPSGIMFDISDTLPQADGSFLWNIGPVGTLSAADVIEVLKEGKATSLFSRISIRMANSLAISSKRSVQPALRLRLLRLRGSMTTAIQAPLLAS